MSSTPAPSTAPGQPVVTQHRVWLQLVITSLVIGAAFIAVYVGLQRDAEPTRLPLAVVGEELSTAAHTEFGDAVKVTQVASIDQGRALVREGNAIAVLQPVSAAVLELDYAGARGPTESGATRQLVDAFGQHTGASVHETDIVPLVEHDSRGLAAFYVVFGVTLSSFVLAQGLTAVTALVRLRHRLYAMAGFAVAIGLVAAIIAGPIYGSLNAPFPLLALSLILLSAASAFTTKALGAWLGPVGIGLAVLALTTLGNASSGATIGYDLLPRWAQTISAILPPGAAVRAVNNFGYFDGHHALLPLLVLALWALAGFALVLLRQHIQRSPKAAVPTTPVKVEA